MAFTVMDSYIDPETKKPLVRDKQENLCSPYQPDRIIFENHDGSYNFSQSNNTEEKKYYENEYRNKKTRFLTIEQLAAGWESEPGFPCLLANIKEEIQGKKILLIGNGGSLKELSLVGFGTRCVFTDLSFEGVLYLKRVFQTSSLAKMYPDNAEFHSADACMLPFADSSFDIIYGCAFVHHISNLDALFSEVFRTLKHGGICRFLDDAYSPLWQFSKETFLHPLQKYSHKKTGISPADKIFTERGGFHEDEIAAIMRKQGFREMLYNRESFFEHLLQRGTLKFNLRFLRAAKPLFRFLDHLLASKTKFIKKNGIRLIWGFTK